MSKSQPQVTPAQTASGKLDLGRDWSLNIGRMPQENEGFPQPDIAVEHPQVSVKHAKLIKEGDRLFIEDVGSSNGTYVGGKRLAKDERVPLHLGEVVYIGPCRVSLKLNGEVEGTKVSCPSGS